MPKLREKVIVEPILNLTDLKAINDSVTSNGTIVNTIQLGLYKLDKNSTATPNDDTVVITNSGIGRWLKIANSEKLQQNAYFVEPVGSNSNNGKNIENAFKDMWYACQKAAADYPEGCTILGTSFAIYTDGTNEAESIIIPPETVVDTKNSIYAIPGGQYSQKIKSGGTLYAKLLRTEAYNYPTFIVQKQEGVSKPAIINCDLAECVFPLGSSEMFGVVKVDNDADLILNAKRLLTDTSVVGIDKSTLRVLTIGTNCNVKITSDYIRGKIYIGAGSKVTISCGNTNDLTFGGEGSYEITGLESLQPASNCVLWRSGGITFNTDAGSETYAFHATTLNNASIVIGNTFILTINSVPYIFIVAATGGGFNFVKGATASDTAINLAATITANLPTYLTAVANAYGAGTLGLTAKAGGDIGNSYLVSTNNATGFAIMADHFIGGGYKKINMPALKIRTSTCSWGDYLPKEKEITIPAELALSITLANKVTYLYIAIDNNGDVIKSGASYYTQSQSGPNATPIGYRRNVLVGIIFHAQGTNIRSIIDAGNNNPSDYGAAIHDLWFAQQNGWSNLGSVVANSTDLSIKSLQSIEYYPEINPLNRTDPNRKIVSGSTIKECVAVYRDNAGGVVYSLHTGLNNYQLQNDRFDDASNLPANPTIPVNTRPLGTVTANQWSARVWYRNPSNGDEAFQYGQITYSGITPPTITQAVAEYNSMVKSTLLDPRQLHSINYLRCTGTNYSLSTDYKSYSYKELISAGIASSSAYTPFSYTYSVNFALTGSDANSGTGFDSPMTLLGAMLKAKNAIGYANITVLGLDGGSYTYNLTGGYSFTNSIQLFAPNIILNGDLEFAANGTHKINLSDAALGAAYAITVSNPSGAVLALFEVKNHLRYRTINFNGAGSLFFKANYLFLNTLTVNYTVTTTTLRFTSNQCGAVTAADSALNSNNIYYDVGAVEAAQNLTYVNVFGRIRKLNAPLTLLNCAVDLTIENTGADIIASGCTGRITILNHTGAIPFSTPAFNVIDGTTPSADKYTYDNSASATHFWKKIAVQNSLAESYNNFTAFVRRFNAAFEPSTTSLDVYAGVSGYRKSTYLISKGIHAATRPAFRIYNDASGYVHVFAKVPAYSFITLLNDNYNLTRLNFLPKWDDAGSGVDPTDITGYVQVYDSEVDSLGYSKSYDMTFDGPFATLPILKIRVAKIANNITLFFPAFATAGNNTSAVIKSQTSLPAGFRPFGEVREHKVEGFQRTGVRLTGTVAVDQNGFITIYQNSEDNIVADNTNILVRAFSVSWSVNDYI